MPFLMSSILARVRKNIEAEEEEKGAIEGEEKKRRTPNEWNELTRFFFLPHSLSCHQQVREYYKHHFHFLLLQRFLFFFCIY